MDHRQLRRFGTSIALANAVSHLEAALARAQTLGLAIWTKQLTPYLALAYLLRREFPRVEAVLETIVPRERQPGAFFERQTARVWGELALAQGAAQVALSIAEQLIVSAPIAAASAGIPSVSQTLGLRFDDRILDAVAVAVAPLWRQRGLEPDREAGLYRHLCLDTAPPGLQTYDTARYRDTMRPLRPVAMPPAGPWRDTTTVD